MAPPRLKPAVRLAALAAAAGLAALEPRLYWLGAPLGAVLVLVGGRLELFVEPPAPEIPHLEVGGEAPALRRPRPPAPFRVPDFLRGHAAAAFLLAAVDAAYRQWLLQAKVGVYNHFLHRVVGLEWEFMSVGRSGRLFRKLTDPVAFERAQTWMMPGDEVYLRVTAVLVALLLVEAAAALAVAARAASRRRSSTGA